MNANGTTASLYDAEGRLVEVDTPSGPGRPARRVSCECDPAAGRTTRTETGDPARPTTDIADTDDPAGSTRTGTVTTAGTPTITTDIWAVAGPP